LRRRRKALHFKKIAPQKTIPHHHLHLKVLTNTLKSSKVKNYKKEDMENNKNNEQPVAETPKKSKLPTILGLIIVLVILAWSATQLVKLFPNAVSSLASLAESVYTFKPSDPVLLEVKNSKNVINTEETITVSWKNDKTNGTYSFEYDCKDGVTIDLSSNEREFKSLSCNQAYDLGLTDNIQIKVNSSKQRFVDIDYNLSYFKKNSNSASSIGSEIISVVNTSISEYDNSEIKTEDEDNENEEKETTVTAPEEDKDKEETVTTKPEETKPEEVKEEETVVTPTPQPTPLPPKVPTYIYEIPVSNPNGQIDLVISNLQIGHIDNTGRFVKTDRVIKGQASALQFTVHNIGQKTSNNWTFKADILGVIVDYKSENQTPLKPNERAITTLIIPASNTFTSEIKIEVNTTEDKNLNNNKLFQNIYIVR